MSTDGPRVPDGPAVNWTLRTRNRVRSVLRRLESLTIRSEQPVDRLVGSARFNPLYHTGTIAVFLFVIVFITGAYLTMFFQFGFEASYVAVTQLEGSLIGRIMRAVHRYASVALVVTSLLHGWRMLVQDRFRGARWLAWVSGIWLMAMVWVIGVTGYWLIWDERAQVLNQIFVRAVDGTTPGLDFVLDNLLTPAAGTGWPFLLLLLLVHIVLSLVIGLLFWYHVKRLNRPLLFPPRIWMSIVGGAIVVVSLLWPLGMLPPLDNTRIPPSFPIDPSYLFLLPAGLSLPPVLVWGGLLVFGVALTLIPWVGGREPFEPILIDPDRCTGCTLCAIDCPYDALEMVARDDGKYRQIAILVPDRCVSCGICIGSCSDDAMSLDGEPIDDLSMEVRRLAGIGESPRIVFTCERHALHGAADPPGTIDATDGDETVHVIPLPCVGMAHTCLAVEALESGAGDVQFVGCPPADCANREGNTWVQERLDRERVPRLKKAYGDAPIRSDWVSPTDFIDALDHPGRHADADPDPAPPWRDLIPVGLLVLVVSLLSIAATNLPFSPADTDGAVLSIALHHEGGAVFAGFDGDPDLGDGGPSRLTVDLDGGTILDETYPLVGVDGTQASIALERITIEPGTYSLLIRVYDRIDRSRFTVLLDDTVDVDRGEIVDLAYIDAPTASSAEAGESLFFERTLGVNTGCRVCHSLDPGVVIIGPSFDGIGARAAATVPGLTAEEYLRQSIVDPDVYVASGFEPGVMPPNFGTALTEEQIDNLVAFLMTFE
ncbi:MAG: hydrogenase iron-sulfur subunit [Actinomycetia bacterium]|nr:hydrogenase iron-sulfur subunit [Actinomycetes bacterium]